MPWKDREKRLQNSRNHYAKNSNVYKIRARAHTTKTRAAIRAYVLQVLCASACADCGENDPVVLEFDHMDPTEKKFCIGAAAGWGFSLEKTKEEMAKCEIRCANCHRRKTARDAGWGSARATSMSHDDPHGK